jgi:hypothetical protein
MFDNKKVLEVKKIQISIDGKSVENYLKEKQFLLPEIGRASCRERV